MSGLVCLKCGKEMEYDWAPCPNCGWKVPEPWEEADEEGEGSPAGSHGAILSKPRKWISRTVWGLLLAGLAVLIRHLIRLYR